MKRKLFILMLAVVSAFACALAFTACGGSNENGNGTDQGGDENPDPVHTHTYKMIQEVFPNCTEQGYNLYACSCGDSYKDDFEDAYGHVWEELDRKHATCSQEGSVEKKCVRCNAETTETLEKTAHSFTWKFDRGNHWQVCSNCRHKTENTAHESDTECSACGFPIAYELSYNEKWYEIVSVDSSVTELETPSEYNGLPIERIREGAFENCTNLTSVTIPDGVRYIDERAFYGCSKLTGIAIPASVMYVENEAFANCTNLKSVTFADDVYMLANSAFSGCNLIDTITCPTNAILTALLRTKNDCLKTFILSGGESIPENSFNFHTDIKSVVISNGISSVGRMAFYGCTSLEEIEFGDCVTSIGYEAFYGCTNLTSVTFPDSMTSIGSYAFYQCSNLTNIAIPDGVTAIVGSTFRSCSNLSSITIPDSVTFIADAAFSRCNSLTIIDFKGTTKQWNAITKDSGWDYDAGDYIVQCTDGKLDKDGNEIND